MSGIFDRWLVGSLFSRILFRIYIRDYSYIYMYIELWKGYIYMIFD